MSDPIFQQFQDVKSFFSLRGDLDGERQEEYSDFEQLIGLTVDTEEFLLPISQISEILMLTTITFVPRSPNYIEGVINLRGIIIPTINLRKMAGHARGKNTQNTRIIVVKHMDMLFGLIVDGITYVQSLAPTEIDQQSLPLKNSNIDVITRIAKKDDAIRGILDVGKIVEIAAEGKHLVEEEEE
jgi:purine-binding chemotaxis protein CheW